jgi:hypothetical protein
MSGAHVGGQIDRHATPIQRNGKRLGREKMTARPAGTE